MKILVALDERNYSKKILKDVGRLAQNTLADIILLGIQKNSQEPKKSLISTMMNYREDVCSYFNPDELPYADFSSSQWHENGKGDWSITSKGIKEFSLMIRAGGVAQQINAVAEEMGSNLIVLGCGNKFGCEWDGEVNVPLRVAEEAPCSVLVIKQIKKSKEIVSILDQSAVSQDSLEMVNQLVTLHDAGLKIIGVKEKKTSKKEGIEKKMIELLRYYNDRKIGAWVKVLNSDEVKSYVTRSSKDSFVALWMGGKQSLIKKLFSRTMVDKLLQNAKTSLFILR